VFDYLWVNPSAGVARRKLRRFSFHRDPMSNPKHLGKHRGGGTMVNPDATPASAY